MLYAQEIVIRRLDGTPFVISQVLDGDQGTFLYRIISLDGEHDETNDKDLKDPRGKYQVRKLNLVESIARCCRRTLMPRALRRGDIDRWRPSNWPFRRSADGARIIVSPRWYNWGMALVDWMLELFSIGVASAVLLYSVPALVKLQSPQIAMLGWVVGFATTLVASAISEKRKRHVEELPILADLLRDLEDYPLILSASTSNRLGLSEWECKQQLLRNTLFLRSRRHRHIRNRVLELQSLDSTRLQELTDLIYAALAGRERSFAEWSFQTRRN
jgi:hypothetical protein